MPPQRRNPPPRVSKGSKQTERSASPRRNTLALLASAALVLLVVVTAAVAWLGGDDRQEAVDPPMAAAGCMLKTYPDQGQQHVDSYDAEVQYNSFPPTSGTHHQVPIIWGAYAEAVPTVAEVHNLEHGGVIIHYGDKVDDATRAELRAFYDDSPDAMLLSPLPKLGAKVTPHGVDEARNLRTIRRGGVCRVPERVSRQRPRTVPDRRPPAGNMRVDRRERLISSRL